MTRVLIVLSGMFPSLCLGAISHVGFDQSDGASANSRTLSEPGTPAENDVHIAVCHMQAAAEGTWTDPTDWTEIDTFHDTTGNPDISIYIGYKVRGATAGQALTFSNSNTADSMACTLHAYRGVDATPFDVAYVKASHFLAGTNAANIDPPAIANNAGATIVLFQGGTQTISGDGGPPSGYAERQDNYNGEGNHRLQYVADLIGSGASANPGVFTHTDVTGTTDSYVFVLALEPAGGGEFDTTPSVASQTSTAYTVTGSLDAAGDVYAVACYKDQTAPSTAQVMAGDCTGDVDAEATDTDSPSTGDFDFSLTLTPTADCANGPSIPCPIYDLYGTDGTNLTTLADEELDPPSACGPGSDEACQQSTLSSIAASGATASVATLAYDAQTGNFIVGGTITDGTSGATARVLADSDGGTTGTLTIRIISGTFGNNNEITDEYFGVADVNGTATFLYSANDILVASAVTYPDDLTLTINAAGGYFSYPASTSARQSAENGLVYDTSAEGYHATGLEYFNNNELPQCDEDTNIVVEDLGNAITSFDLDDFVTDAEGDTITWALAPFADSYVSGLSLSGGNALSGTPATEVYSTPDDYYHVATDYAGDICVHHTQLYIPDGVPMPDIEDSDVSDAVVDELAAFPWRDEPEGVGTTVCNKDEATGEVIDGSQSPAAAAEVDWDVAITYDVSTNSCNLRPGTRGSQLRGVSIGL